MFIRRDAVQFQIPDSRFQIPDSRFQIPDSRFQMLIRPSLPNGGIPWAVTRPLLPASSLPVFGTVLTPYTICHNTTRNKPSLPTKRRRHPAASKAAPPPLSIAPRRAPHPGTQASRIELRICASA
ncbi:hypothetical protein SNOG_06642 [Parastagonospora nodorum SN15]|uniref:Uncharacterized protein n=1 Tax=Phaeosphaeria nodorum (strain SN15 / ATCC MYA-4574 / FGSC 10173) TaxID=321614 RepID=Q0UNM2_PHANO|nr:hypothetical protein SNOG_06642 [Parastagonospora nodorum SN15]EAT86473.1 hypothetical protein SNOG_06642 [Parastagonospora nodorum SN15]